MGAKLESHCSTLRLAHRRHEYVFKHSVSLYSAYRPHLVSGYTVCGLYPTEVTGRTVFDPRLQSWISTFYAVSFIQSFLTTGLMAFRIWQTDNRSKKYRADKSNLIPVVRILIESAALQLLVEFLLLILYAINLNAQFILLETVTPLVVRLSDLRFSTIDQYFANNVLLFCV